MRKNFPFTNFYMFVIKNLNVVGYSPKNINIENQFSIKMLYLNQNGPTRLIKLLMDIEPIESAQKEMIKTMTILYVIR